MPEYRAVVMSSEHKDALDRVTALIRLYGEHWPEIREEVYFMANLYQDVVDEIWNNGHEIFLNEDGTIAFDDEPVFEFVLED